MPYIVLLDDISTKFWGDKGNWKNLTLDLISKKGEILRAIYERIVYDDDYYANLNYEEKVEYIKDSEIYYDIVENYSIMLDYIHVLQSEPTEEDIFKVYKNTSNIVLLKDDMNNCYIGMIGIEADFSEEVAYTYMVVDHYVPPGFNVDKNNNHSLKKETHKELIEFLCKSGYYT